MNDTDGRCSRRETCDQSSQLSQFLSVSSFLEMLEYFFFLDAKKPIFIFLLHYFLQIYILLSTNGI